MKPKSNHIFLEPIEKNTTTLILLPRYERKHKTFLSGKVIAKGPSVSQVNIGDEVAYGLDVGITVEVDEKKIVIIKPSHILAIV